MFGSIEATLTLPAAAASAAEARTFVRGLLDRWRMVSYEEAAVLLVSELVTNAVVHAYSAPDLTVRLRREVLWVGVADIGAGAPAQRPHQLDALSGRGLRLVDQIASSWGVQPRPVGKVVWFELDRTSTAAYGSVLTGRGPRPSV